MSEREYFVITYAAGYLTLDDERGQATVTPRFEDAAIWYHLPRALEVSQRFGGAIVRGSDRALYNIRTQSFD